MNTIFLTEYEGNGWVLTLDDKTIQVDGIPKAKRLALAYTTTRQISQRSLIIYYKNGRTGEESI